MIINLTVDNFIRINLSALPHDIISEIIRECTYSNPEFEARLRAKKKIIGLPQFLKTYRIEDDIILVPRGKILFLKRLLSEHDLKFRVLDNRLTNFFQKTVEFHSDKKLFDYQDKACRELTTYTQRLLSSDCGSGKTVIGCGVIRTLQQWTLIAVDTTELMEQWKFEIKKFLNIDFEIGQIGAGEMRLGPITIALVQSLHLLNEEDWKTVNDSFSCFIYDEVQGLPAPTRFEIITKFRGKYLYGLSATIKRSDGLEFFTFDSISPEIVRVDEQDLKDADRFLDVDLVFVKGNTIKNTPREFKNLVWNDLIDRMISDKRRNQMIADDIADMVKLGHKSIVLSSRLEHCKDLVSLVSKLGVNVKLFTGDVHKDDRQDIKSAFETENIQCIVATNNIALKGLNIPSLSCLHLPLPIKDHNLLQQATGRIRRVFPGKVKPMVRDYVDMSAPILKKKAKNRSTIYDELKYIKILNLQDLFATTGTPKKKSYLKNDIILPKSEEQEEI